jgi:hypothetical protein
MSILKQYLEEARRHEEIRKGNISKKNIEKMKKSGALKSKEDYYKGIDRGSDNIIKKHHGKVNYDSEFATKNGAQYRIATNSIELPSTDKYTRYNLISMKTKKQVKKDEPISKRHEAYEMASAHKGRLGIKITKFKKIGVGKHRSIDVLRNEKRDSDFASKVYNNYQEKDRRKFRKSSGEYDLVDKTSTRKRRKLNKTFDAKVDTTTKGDVAKAVGTSIGATAVGAVIGSGIARYAANKRKKKSFMNRLKSKFKGKKK